MIVDAFEEMPPNDEIWHNSSTWYTDQSPFLGIASTELVQYAINSDHDLVEPYRKSHVPQDLVENALKDSFIQKYGLDGQIQIWTQRCMFPLNL